MNKKGNSIERTYTHCVVENPDPIGPPYGMFSFKDDKIVAIGTKKQMKKIAKYMNDVHRRVEKKKLSFYINNNNSAYNSNFFLI